MENEQIYQLCTQIPTGKVTTYGEIARKLGTKGFQAIGQILSKNPYAPKVPCHRVVKSNGEIGGFKGSQDNQQKIKLLQQEGVIVKNNKIDLKKYLYQF